MKVNDLLEGKFAGYDLPNKKGAIKRFPNDWSPEAVAWMRSEIDPKEKDKAKFSKAKKEWYVRTREQEIALMHRKLGITPREPEWKPPRPNVSLKEVYDKFIDLVDRFFPDGDPMDYWGNWFSRRGIHVNYDEWINRALKRFGTGEEKKGYSHYLGTMWEQMALDSMHDAQQAIDDGDDVDDTDFYTVNDGKIEINDNPYWTSKKQKDEREKRAKEDAAWEKKNAAAKAKQEKLKKEGKLDEDAMPHYKFGQHLVVSGKEGFQATTVNARDYIGSDSKAEYSSVSRTTIFKNQQSGYDWTILFDHDDGKRVYFRAGKNMWSAEREPFYANVASLGKNFMTSLVDRSDDESQSTT